MILKEDAKKFPIYHALIVLCLAVGLCGIPLSFITEKIVDNALWARYIEEIFKRLIISIVAIIFIFKYGFFDTIKNKLTFFSFIAIIPAILVAINNFPIIGVASGNIVVSKDKTDISLFILYSLSIGLFEEIVFRGILFPLCLIKLKGRKNYIFWAIVLSSALFSASHLLNLLAGSSPLAVLLQIGYSFLIGSMCAICLVKTGNLFVPVIIHFIYDIGGLLVGDNGIATGNQWDTITIIITAILSIIVIIYMIFMTLSYKDEDIKRVYGNAFLE